MFPLSSVLFPHMVLPLHVFEPRYQVLLEDCLAAQREFGVVLITRGSEVGGGDTRASVGTVARIVDAAPLGDGHWLVVTVGTERISVREWLEDDPYPRALADVLATRDAGDLDAPLGAATAALGRARALLSELGATSRSLVTDDVSADRATAAWQLCAQAPVTAFDAQRLLTTDDTAARLELLAELANDVADDAARLLAQGPS